MSSNFGYKNSQKNVDILRWGLKPLREKPTREEPDMAGIEVLTQALKLEEEGRAFYMRAADMSKDPDAMKMFRSLADDEADHFNYIERQIKALQDGKDWVEIPQLQNVEAIDAEAPVFPAGKQAPAEIADGSSEEDVLLFGLGAETRSYELYTRAAGESTHPVAADLFRKLASAERGHFDVLMMRYESRFGYPR
jgi:rubrerythrin